MPILKFGYQLPLALELMGDYMPAHKILAALTARGQVGNHGNPSIIKITVQDTAHAIPSINRPEGFLRHQATPSNLRDVPALYLDK